MITKLLITQKLVELDELNDQLILINKRISDLSIYYDKTESDKIRKYGLNQDRERSLNAINKLVQTKNKLLKSQSEARDALLKLELDILSFNDRSCLVEIESSNKRWILEAKSSGFGVEYKKIKNCPIVVDENGNIDL